MTIRNAMCVGVLAFVLAGAVADADPLGDDMGLRRRPRFMRQVFSPRLIMRHQGDIELTDEQRSTITSAMSEVQSATVELRWDLEKASGELEGLLEGVRADQAAVVKKAEQVMALEQRMKLALLAMMVRVKNELSAEQQATLRTLRSRERNRRGRGGPRRE